MPRLRSKFTPSPEGRAIAIVNFESCCGKHTLVTLANLACETGYGQGSAQDTERKPERSKHGRLLAPREGLGLGTEQLN